MRTETRWKTVCPSQKFVYCSFGVKYERFVLLTKKSFLCYRIKRSMEAQRNKNNNRKACTGFFLLLWAFVYYKRLQEREGVLYVIYDNNLWVRDRGSHTRTFFPKVFNCCRKRDGVGTLVGWCYSFKFFSLVIITKL